MVELEFSTYQTVAVDSDGKQYRAVDCTASILCYGCIFYFDSEPDCQVANYDARCVPMERIDNKFIIWQPIEDTTNG